MAQVLFAPASRRNYELSLEGFVPFDDAGLRAALSPEQLAGLETLHPSGKAHFWGAIAYHSKMMERLRPGDPVVFFGDKKIRAFGEIGYLFANDAFADAVWGRNHNDKSFTYVYSVINVRTLDRPIEDLWQLDGFTSGDYVYGQRLVPGARADLVIDAFGLHTSMAEAAMYDRLVAVSRALDEGSRIVTPEARHTDTFFQHMAEREEMRFRVESQLVAHFQDAHPGQDFSSFITPGGRRTDLYFVDDHTSEIIEAKAFASHDKVREAVAQLLDYAPYSPQPVTRLTALFPERPEPMDVRFLHRLGMDCVYRTYSEHFDREEAPEFRRRYMSPVWRGPA